MAHAWWRDADYELFDRLTRERDEARALYRDAEERYANEVRSHDTTMAERDEARAELARLQDLHTRCAAFDDQPGPSCVTLKAEVARLREALESLREVLSHLSRNRSQFWWETNEELALTGLRNAEAALAETDPKGGE